MERYGFLDIFEENPDGTLSPRRMIEINGVQFGPGVRFGSGVALGGVDIHQYKYSVISADEQDGVLIIRGFFRS